MSLDDTLIPFCRSPPRGRNTLVRVYVCVSTVFTGRPCSNVFYPTVAISTFFASRADKAEIVLYHFLQKDARVMFGKTRMLTNKSARLNLSDYIPFILKKWIRLGGVQLLASTFSRCELLTFLANWAIVSLTMMLESLQRLYFGVSDEEWSFGICFSGMRLHAIDWFLFPIQCLLLCDRGLHFMKLLRKI